MSQLAAQLRIMSKATGTNSSSYASNQHYYNASFLFDAAAAADIDNETAYNLGLNGLIELMKIDDRFSAFEHTLFSKPTGLSFDRHSQTPKQLRELDQSLVRFLRCLSPHFLMKPAHKCLEYLIRRFEIHLHETCIEGVIECILPYHETPLFVRMVQLLRVPDNSRWKFLLTGSRKERVALSRYENLSHAFLRIFSGLTQAYFLTLVKLWITGTYTSIHRACVPVHAYTHINIYTYTYYVRLYKHTHIYTQASSCREMCA